jgi:uncharacterized protein YbjT (DUF2867 family)
MSAKTALLFGASGLVGSYVLKLLLNSNRYSKVIVFSRQKLILNHPKIENHVIDFDQLEKYKKLITGNDLFCCLGTTIKKAESKEAFRKVDYEYPVRLAEIANQKKVGCFVVISSLGANSHSSVFYSKVKGEMEEAIKRNFRNKKVIVRPSILFGERTESRMGENIGKVVVKLFGVFMAGFLKKYKGIHAETVATSMISLANCINRKIVFESHELQRIAKENMKYKYF